MSGSISAGVTIKGGAKRRIVSWVQLIREPFSELHHRFCRPDQSPRSSPLPPDLFYLGKLTRQRLQPLLRKCPPTRLTPLQESRFQGAQKAPPGPSP